ncbi:MAG: hypothetical protein HZC24_15020 [Rhodocyclales bacterium]|nr:hypothetical protein [Rhodocyclales bacterium]
MVADGESRTRRDFRGRRWLSVFLRGAHLIAVIAFGAALLPAPAEVPSGHAGAAMLLTGLLMWLLDLWHKPYHLLEGAGLSMLAKLALVAWMVVSPDLRLPLFWLVVAWSAVFSHAPIGFRNARVLGKLR